MRGTFILHWSSSTCMYLIYCLHSSVNLCFVGVSVMIDRDGCGAVHCTSAGRQAQQVQQFVQHSLKYADNISTLR